MTVVALPSKGSLYGPGLEFFSNCGLPVRRDGRDGRGYWGSFKGVDGSKIQFLRAEEIPFRVDAGDILIGITGRDLYEEHCYGSSQSELLLERLGFGYARLVIAVPKVWIDVDSLDDLAEVAAGMKQSHGRGLRVGTKFQHMTRAFFRNRAIQDYLIVDSQGATEGMPEAGAADVIVDLTSSGQTLIENDLKEIDGGTVVESEAALIVNTDPARWDEAAIGLLRRLVDHIEAGLRAKQFHLVHFCTALSVVRDVTRELSEEFGCEIHDPPADDTEGDRLADAGYPVSVSVVCPVKKIYNVVQRLRDKQASSISVLKPSLMFDNAPDTVSWFQQRLKSNA